MRATSAEPNRWLHRFVCATALATLLLICSGGMVTSKGVGLAVPDWPTTFGYNMFLFPASQWVGGVFFEHTHRLAASTVGLLTIVLTAWLWRKDERRLVKYLGLAALAAVIVQGVLGGLRVTMLKDEIGVFHACLAQAFFGSLVLIALVTSRTWASVPRQSMDRSILPLAMIATALIYLQLGLGATMRHQHRDLAITDFPTAYGQWLPDTTPAAVARINGVRDAAALSDVSAGQIWLQMFHRFGAVAVTVAVITLWFRVRRKGASVTALHRVSTVWLLLLACQLTLGAWTIWTNKAADVATAHVAVGATMLAVGVIVCGLLFRTRRTGVSLLPVADSSFTVAVPV